MSMEFEQFISKMQSELNEIEIKAGMRKAGAAIKKGLVLIPGKIKAVLQKMAQQVKRIEKSWFIFHAAICRLKNNKYARSSKSEQCRCDTNQIGP